MFSSPKLNRQLKKDFQGNNLIPCRTSWGTQGRLSLIQEAARNHNSATQRALPALPQISQSGSSNMVPLNTQGTWSARSKRQMLGLIVTAWNAMFGAV